ncbi:MAG TPA: hypothetical protein VK601_24075, partial [Kofleriaceae bacterium]|nr:hypothetical protein [Kofleriaceae bacterium]
FVGIVDEAQRHPRSPLRVVAGGGGARRPAHAAAPPASETANCGIRFRAILQVGFGARIEY